MAANNQTAASRHLITKSQQELIESCIALRHRQSVAWAEMIELHIGGIFYEGVAAGPGSSLLVLSFVLYRGAIVQVTQEDD